MAFWSIQGWSDAIGCCGSVGKASTHENQESIQSGGIPEEGPFTEAAKEISGGFS